eukprot:1518878-Pyramimonas_sp.AAC.1
MGAREVAAAHIHHCFHHAPVRPACPAGAAHSLARRIWRRRGVRGYGGSVGKDGMRIRTA